RFRVLIADELDGLCPYGRRDGHLDGQLDGPLDGQRLVAHPGDRVTRIQDARASAGRTLLAIGPEGGWDRFELDLLEGHGFTRVSMGARTLRSDTACVALLSALS